MESERALLDCYEQTERDRIEKAFDALDRKAEKDPNEFFVSLANVLESSKDAEGKSAAVKELARHFGCKRTMFIGKIQQQKWNGLQDDTKNRIEKVLMQLLSTLDEKNLVQPVINIFGSVIFPQNSGLFTKMIDILKCSGLNETARNATLQIIRNIDSSKWSINADDLLQLFSNGLSSGETQLNTLETMKVLIEKMDPACDKETQRHNKGGGQFKKLTVEFTKTLSRVVNQVTKSNLLVQGDENVCIAAISLLTAIVSAQTITGGPTERSAREISVERWKKFFSTNHNHIRTQLQAVSEWAARKEQEKIQSLINLFYEKLNILD